MGNTCRDLLVMLLCWLWLVNGMPRGGGMQPPRPKRRGRWAARRSRAGRVPGAQGAADADGGQAAWRWLAWAADMGRKLAVASSKWPIKSLAK